MSCGCPGALPSRSAPTSPGEVPLTVELSALTCSREVVEGGRDGAIRIDSDMVVFMEDEVRRRSLADDVLGFCPRDLSSYLAIETIISGKRYVVGVALVVDALHIP